MRRGWTTFWRCGRAAIVAGITFLPAGAAQHSRASEQAQLPVPPQKRANELTLARLRPGVDTIARAEKLYEKKQLMPLEGSDEDRGAEWRDDCLGWFLQIESADTRVIRSVRVALFPTRRRSDSDCPVSPNLNSKVWRWKTGRGLALGDGKSRVIKLYGPPQSVGPSTEGGRELELMFYAFDWAGPDVPQVMEVTLEKGRVVKILLAAESL